MLNYAKLIKNAHFLAILAIFQIVAASTIFGSLCSMPVSAASLTLAVPSELLSLEVQPSIQGSFTKSDIGYVSVSTDAPSGYSLSVATKPEIDHNSLVNNEFMLNSINESVTEEDFQNDINYNNKWGFLPNKLDSLSNDMYRPGPTASTPMTIDVTHTENSSVANDYGFSFATKIDATQPSGSYSGNFVFTVSVNPDPIDYSINYHQHVRDEVNNMPKDFTGNSIDGFGVISEAIPIREGFHFIGWCDEVPEGRSGLNECGGTTYQSSQSYLINRENPELTLYALWEADVKVNLTFIVGDNIDRIVVGDMGYTYDSFYALPNHELKIKNVAENEPLIVIVTPSPNNQLSSWERDTNAGVFDSETLLSTVYHAGAESEILTANGSAGDYPYMQEVYNCDPVGTNLTDKRDGKSYAVAKLAGRCFMLASLRLASGTSLTVEDSDISAPFTLPTEEWNGVEQDYYNKAIMKEYVNHGYVQNYYYNWYAATANPNNPDIPVTSASYAGSTAEEDGQALGSICPKNWTLPIQNGPLDLDALWDNGNNPAKLTDEGRFYGGHRYTGSRWWSNTRLNSTEVYDLEFHHLNGPMFEESMKFRGLSIRCASRWSEGATSPSDWTY